MQTSELKHRTSCRLCKNKRLKTIYDLRSTPIGDDYVKNSAKKQKKHPLKLNICTNCKFIQLSHIVNTNIVYGNYLYSTQTSYGLPKHFENLVKNLFLKKIINKESKVLEIGSNDGTLLNFISSYGCEVLGVDPARELARNTPFKTINNFFTYKLSKKIKKDYGAFDLIIANNVIANIDDLDTTFEGIAYLLKSNGFFVIETFSLKGIVKENLIDNIYHEHLSYFTTETLIKFAKKFNLHIFSTEHLSVKGGSIRLVFSKREDLDWFKYVKGNLYNKDEEKNKKLFNKNIKVEEKLKLGSIKTYSKLKNKNNITKSKIQKFVKSEILKGKEFAGYGASIGTTTLLHEYDLGNSIKYLFDNEKKRHNLYSPGYKIKVLHPKKIKKIKPHYIIIFAWRYAKTILKKNKKYFNKNVKFILPHPKFKILK